MTSDARCTCGREVAFTDSFCPTCGRQVGPRYEQQPATAQSSTPPAHVRIRDLNVHQRWAVFIGSTIVVLIALAALVLPVRASTPFGAFDCGTVFASLTDSRSGVCGPPLTERRNLTLVGLVAGAVVAFGGEAAFRGRPRSL